MVLPSLYTRLSQEHTPPLISDSDGVSTMGDVLLPGSGIETISCILPLSSVLIDNNLKLNFAVPEFRSKNF